MLSRDAYLNGCVLNWEVTVQLVALTILYICTRWVEIAPLSDRTSEEAAFVLDRTWLARYPRPREVIHDNGTEFSTEF